MLSLDYRKFTMEDLDKFLDNKESGKDLNFRDSCDTLNGTVFYHICYFCNINANFNFDMLSLCLKKGADLNTNNYNGETPFRALCLYSKNAAEWSKIINLCLDYGVDLNCVGNNKLTPFYLLCHNPLIIFNEILLERCLKNGANLNIQISDGETPFHVLCSQHTKPGSGLSVEMLELYLKYGADLCIRNNEGKTPFHILYFDRFDGRDKVLKYIGKNKLIPDAILDECMPDRKLEYPYASIYFT